MEVNCDKEQWLHACVYLKEQCSPFIPFWHMRTDQNSVVKISKRDSLARLPFTTGMSAYMHARNLNKGIP